MTILVLLVHKTTELKVSRWEFRLFSEWKLSIFKTIIENADFLQHSLHISMYQVSRMLVFGNIRPSQPRAERSITNNWCMLKCTWSLVYPVASCQPNWYYWILTATWLFTFFFGLSQASIILIQFFAANKLLFVCVHNFFRFILICVCSVMYHQRN